MKKTLVILAAICISFATKAQLTQGTISLGGILNYTSSSTKTHNGSTTNDFKNYESFQVGPRIGYFIADNVSLGAEVSYMSISRPINGWGNMAVSNEQFFAFRPFARIHKSIGEKFFLFGEGMISVGTGGEKYTSGSTTVNGDKLSLFGVSISPGILFTPTEKFGIELSFTGIDFSSITSKNRENSTIKEVDNTFRIGPNTFSPNLGIQIYF